MVVTYPDARISMLKVIDIYILTLISGYRE